MYKHNKKVPKLIIITPCYNEEEVLPAAHRLLAQELLDLKEAGLVLKDSGLLFVDDGSTDRTWDIIQTLAEQDHSVSGIHLGKNRGHQNALLAGMVEAEGNCDIAITIDCDGQDDPAAMSDMVLSYIRGAEIVYGVRKDRSQDSFFKRVSAHGFYRLMHLLGTDVIYDHADYRLVSDTALKSLKELHVTDPFLRGIFPSMGYSGTCVEYDRKERIAGKTHYPLRKMVRFALSGIFSCSKNPLYMIPVLGLLVMVPSLISGWSGTARAVFFVGGLQIFCTGITGIYAGRSRVESSHGPQYIITERTKTDK